MKRKTTKAHSEKGIEEYVIEGFEDDGYFRQYRDIYYVNKSCMIYSVKNDMMLKGYINKNGYIQYKLRKVPLTGHKIEKEQMLGHRVMAEVFMTDKIPDCRYLMHHKDHQRSNNRLENLEILTYSEHGKKEHQIHNAYAKSAMLSREVNSVPIAKYGLDGIFICWYASTYEALKILEKARSSKNAIYEALKNPKEKTAFGYRWVKIEDEFVTRCNGEIIVDESKIPTKIEVSKLYDHGRKLIIGKCIDNNSNVIEERYFVSIEFAAKFMGLSRSSIVDNLADRTKISMRNMIKRNGFLNM
ncbi:MAG: endonuclease [Clostridiaceae bacterium]|jgi:hypothetical protein|nr:endonuclease [Clostridiaceae bacterium]